jgi:hypothetical protein
MWTVVAMLLWMSVIGLFLSFLCHWRFQRMMEPPIPRHTAPRKETRYDRMRRNGGSHTQEEWISLCIPYKGQCPCCRRKRALTKDHIIPVAWAARIL